MERPTASDSEFLELLREFEPLIWYAAKRFSIPGVLLPEDLYQEGLIALEETVVYHLDLLYDSPEFTRAFKSRLFHRVQEVLRKHKTSSRDWRKEMRSVVTDFDGDVTSVVERIKQTTFPPPDRTVQLRDLTKFIEGLRQDLKEASLAGSLWGNPAEDALEILDIVSTDDYEIPEHVRYLYERMPTQMTNAILSEITGWDKMKVRRAVRRLRKHATRVASLLGYTVPRSDL